MDSPKHEPTDTMSTINELFPAEEITQDSPRLAWLKKHGLEIGRSAFAGQRDEEWTDGEVPEQA